MIQEQANIWACLLYTSLCVLQIEFGVNGVRQILQQFTYGFLIGGNHSSLGEFKPGAGKNLIVKLSLSEEMDNEYQELLGKVKWVFSASQASSDSSSDQNGDRGHNADENNGDGRDNGGSGNKSGNGNNGENGNNGGSGYNGGGDSLNGAAGEKVYATASASPKTGDNTNLLARWFALFAAALVLAVTARKLYRKEKDR